MPRAVITEDRCGCERQPLLNLAAVLATAQAARGPATDVSVPSIATCSHGRRGHRAQDRVAVALSNDNDYWPAHLLEVLLAPIAMRHGVATRMHAQWTVTQLHGVLGPHAQCRAAALPHASATATRQRPPTAARPAKQCRRHDNAIAISVQGTVSYRVGQHGARAQSHAAPDLRHERARARCNPLVTVARRALSRRRP
jgi:hypothetical protein